LMRQRYPPDTELLAMRGRLFFFHGGILSDLSRQQRINVGG
jgi:hypothetical protein